MIWQKTLKEKSFKERKRCDMREKMKTNEGGDIKEKNLLRHLRVKRS